MATPRSEVVELIDMAARATGSQAAAARAAGLRPQKVSDWKQGQEEPPPEAVAALAHVAGLDATEWLARATLWRCAGKPYEQALRSGLGKRLQAIGGVVASCFVAVILASLPATEAHAESTTMYIVLMTSIAIGYIHCRTKATAMKWGPLAIEG